MSFESFPPSLKIVAAELPEYKKWRYEGVEGVAGTLFTPEGSAYTLEANESLVFQPSEPTENEQPQPYILNREDGSLKPFAEWASAEEPETHPQ